jgi:hypothetical protein
MRVPHEQSVRAARSSETGTFSEYHVPARALRSHPRSLLHPAGDVIFLGTEGISTDRREGAPWARFAAIEPQARITACTARQPVVREEGLAAFAAPRATTRLHLADTVHQVDAPS